MKIIHRFIYIIALVGLFTNAGYAQRGYTSLTYSPSVPFGATADYINETAWRGGGIEAGAFLGPGFSLGLSGNWHVFYEDKNVSTMQIGETTTISGNEYRYINAFPVFATAKIYFGDLEGLTSYAGLGVGTIYLRQQTLLGGFRFSDNGWQVGVFPELGLQYRLGQTTNIILSTRYNHGFETQRVANSSYVNINLGLSFLY